MGELYYNWEMYGGSPVDQDRARLGWYWTGNPNLKPEKSLNFDIGIEGETKRTTMRMNLFRNTIRNYMTTLLHGVQHRLPSESQNGREARLPARYALQL